MPYADKKKRLAYHREYMKRYYVEHPEYRARCKERQQTPEYKETVKRYRKTERGGEFARAALRRYFKTEKGREARARYVKNNPEKYSARQAVLVAKRSGKLVPGPCEICGVADTEAHHDDYSKPLEVRWFCKPHHEEHEHD